MWPARQPTAAEAKTNSIAGSLSSSLGTLGKAAPSLLLPGGAALSIRGFNPHMISVALSSSLGPSKPRRPPPPPWGRRTKFRPGDGPRHSAALSSSLGPLEQSGGAPPPPWASSRPFLARRRAMAFGGPLLLPRAAGAKRRCPSSSLGIAAPLSGPATGQTDQRPSPPPSGRWTVAAVPLLLPRHRRSFCPLPLELRKTRTDSPPPQDGQDRCAFP